MDCLPLVSNDEVLLMQGDNASGAVDSLYGPREIPATVIVNFGASAIGAMALMETLRIP